MLALHLLAPLECRIYRMGVLLVTLKIVLCRVWNCRVWVFVQVHLFVLEYVCVCVRMCAYVCVRVYIFFFLTSIIQTTTASRYTRVRFRFAAGLGRVNVSKQSPKRATRRIGPNFERAQARKQGQPTHEQKTRATEMREERQ